MQKRVPYAVADYEEIVEDNYYYVDKTRFIRVMENWKIPVFLRPRRFGKSLWCSVLECYYDINRKNKFDDLFGHTDIAKDPTRSCNSLMVMRFDFSVIKLSEKLDELEEEFDSVCVNSFKIFKSKYSSLLSIPEPDQMKNASDGVRKIFTAARMAGAPEIMVIIDEYDNFTNQLLTSGNDSLYGDVTTGDSFLRTFFKTIKSAVGEGIVERVFITGVLPVTMDDLTSGFNIGEVVTLEKPLLNMMGFTQAETDTYVDRIFSDYGWDDILREKVREDLRSHYNGYRLLPDAKESLYNSTIMNFYLKKLLINNGEIPTETIDENLRVDINWLRRLTGSDAETRELLEKLVFEGELAADTGMMRSKFNMQKFTEKEFYPLSLYFLGMVTFKDDLSLHFPNLTTKSIFIDYFNEIENIQVSLGYQDMFREFHKIRSLENLFAGYWEMYIGQIPAQAFDKVNENFIRTTFYELCTRYLSRYFMFAIEVNRPSGRSDWEAMGRDGTPFEGTHLLIEFKHYTKGEGKKLGVLNWDIPQDDDVDQVSGYAEDVKRIFPDLTVSRHVCYTLGNKGFRFFTLD